MTRARLSKTPAQVQAVWVQPGEGRVLASLDRFGRCLPSPHPGLWDHHGSKTVPVFMGLVSHWEDLSREENRTWYTVL